VAASLPKVGDLSGLAPARTGHLAESRLAAASAERLSMQGSAVQPKSDEIAYTSITSLAVAWIGPCRDDVQSVGPSAGEYCNNFDLEFA
jgi:hypothetical protein